MATKFEDEYATEIGKGHPLYGVPVRAIGRRIDRDDVLFQLLRHPDRHGRRRERIFPKLRRPPTSSARDRYNSSIRAPTPSLRIQSDRLAPPHESPSVMATLLRSLTRWYLMRSAVPFSNW